MTTKQGRRSPRPGGAKEHMYLEDSSLPTTEPLILSAALLVFRNTTQEVLMRGDVTISKHGPKITDLTPVTEDLTERFIRAQGAVPLSYIASNVLAVNRTSCAWFVPAQNRVMNYQPSYDHSLAALSGKAFPQPPLVMISQQQGHQAYLQVFALRENVRPEPHTPLMLAPFHNIYDQHTVCFGQNTLPGGSTPTYQHAWETMFYATPFSHPGGTYRRWDERLTHTEMWLGAEEQAHFNTNWLRPCPGQLTLETVLCTPFTRN